MGFKDHATTKAPSKSAKQYPTASVNDKVKQAVDDVISLKAKMDVMKDKLAEAQQTILDHVYPQYAALARAGNFTKTIKVEGNNGTVKFNAKDAFSKLKPEDVPAAKKLLAKKFGEFYHDDLTITVKKNVSNNAKAIRKLEAMMEKAGIDIGEFFDVVESIITVKGFDQKQFELDEAKRVKLLSLTPQYKPSIS